MDLINNTLHIVFISATTTIVTLILIFVAVGFWMGLRARGFFKKMKKFNKEILKNFIAFAKDAEKGKTENLKKYHDELSELFRARNHFTKEFIKHKYPGVYDPLLEKSRDLPWQELAEKFKNDSEINGIKDLQLFKAYREKMLQYTLGKLSHFEKERKLKN